MQENPDRISGVPAGAPSAPRKRGVGTVVLTLILLLAACALVNATLLQITTVTVIGNRQVSREQVIARSGLDGRVGYLNVSEESIARGINSDPYLVFERLEKEFPNRLIIYVRERTPAANLVMMSNQFILDEEGFVLEKTEEQNLGNGLINVTGMKVRHMEVGEEIQTVSASQMDAYRTVMAEIVLQNCGGTLSELNVSDVDNLYLVTVDGCTVKLGTAEDIRGKLLTVRGVKRYLDENGYAPGALDATQPGYATYTPPEL